MQASKSNIMYTRTAFVLTFATLILFSCAQQDLPKKSSKEDANAQAPEEHKKQHPYGGWYCPDNILGFPPVDIAQLYTVPVITDRLPTREEARSEQSLMYIDTAEYPNARPFNLDLPRLARFYNPHTEKQELIVVIQAVNIGQDSVVGFRYINGGNGSAWLDEIRFISDSEQKTLGESHFASFNMEISAGKDRVWEVLTSTDFADQIWHILYPNATVISDWQRHSEVLVRDDSGKTQKIGTVTVTWPELYIQVDDNTDGQHYVEKFLILENKEKNTVQLHLVAGPLIENYSERAAKWRAWLLKVKGLSEAS